jgi:hypothetical protein
MAIRRTLVASLCIACIAITAKAHEFWIDPEAHSVAAGAEVVANLRNGQQYEGSALSYIPRNFRRFDYVMGGAVKPVEGLVGDRPAMKVTPEAEGLLVAIHTTTDSLLVWDDWEKFESFLKHKDLTWALAEHDARGLSHEKVRERYSRYVKSLIAVGSGEGDDIEAGLLTEIVALENPYTGEMSDGLDIRVLYEGAPRADTQVEVFEKAADGTVEISYIRTDDKGEVTVPVRPGNRYMLDAVVLRPVEAVEEKDPVWESLWANLTLEVPGE